MDHRRLPIPLPRPPADPAQVRACQRILRLPETGEFCRRTITAAAIFAKSWHRGPSLIPLVLAKASSSSLLTDHCSPGPPMMIITPDHWISGIRRDPLDGGSSMGTRRFLVIHHTEGWGAQTSIDGWKAKGNGVCAHLIIDRDGTIIQCRPFDRTCGHAGVSHWRDPHTGTLYTGLNSCAIGIELANSGTLPREYFPSTCGPALSGKPIPRITARHKNGGPISRWETYPAAQLQACQAVSQALVARYHLDDLLGHEDCSPDRKTDPGPAFDLPALRLACGFTAALAKL